MGQAWTDMDRWGTSVFYGRAELLFLLFSVTRHRPKVFFEPSRTKLIWPEAPEPVRASPVPGHRSVPCHLARRKEPGEVWNGSRSQQQRIDQVEKHLGCIKRVRWERVWGRWVSIGAQAQLVHWRLQGEILTGQAEPSYRRLATACLVGAHSKLTGQAA